MKPTAASQIRRRIERISLLSKGEKLPTLEEQNHGSVLPEIPMDRSLKTSFILHMMIALGWGFLVLEHKQDVLDISLFGENALSLQDILKSWRPDLFVLKFSCFLFLVSEILNVVQTLALILSARKVAKESSQKTSPSFLRERRRQLVKLWKIQKAFTSVGNSWLLTSILNVFHECAEDEHRKILSTLFDIASWLAIAYSAYIAVREFIAILAYVYFNKKRVRKEDAPLLSWFKASVIFSEKGDFETSSAGAEFFGLCQLTVIFVRAAGVLSSEHLRFIFPVSLGIMLLNLALGVFGALREAVERWLGIPSVITEVQRLAWIIALLYTDWSCHTA